MKKTTLWGGLIVLIVYAFIGLPLFFSTLSCGVIGDECNTAYSFLIVSFPGAALASLITQILFPDNDTAWLLITLISSSVIYFGVGMLFGKLYRYLKS